jgi:phage/plasmid-associated DNA primase
MNIINFCEFNGLKYMPIAYHLEDGKKRVYGENNNLTIKEIDKYKNLILKENNENNKNHILKKKIKDKNQYFIDPIPPNSIIAYSIYLKYSYCYVIDIDDPIINHINQLNNEYDILKTTSWCRGNTKGIHIYLWCEDMPEDIKQIDVLKYHKGDLINLNNIWENQNKTIFNGDNMIIVKYEDIKHLLKDNIENNKNKKEIIKNEEHIKPNINEEHIKPNIFDDNADKFYKLLEEIINNYKVERSINYELWRNVGMALKSFSNEYDTYKIFYKFSERSNFHKQNHNFKQSIDQFWKTFKIEGRVYNFFSMLRWLKEDNLIIYYKIKNEYQDLLKKEEFYINPIDTGDYLLKYVYKIKSVILNEEQSFIYIFDDQINIWQKLKSIKELQSYITNYLKKFNDECGPFENFNDYLKSHNINEIANYIFRITLNNQFYELLDNNREVLNFKNGVLNLKTGEFRSRTETDFYVVYENYDYNPNISTAIMNELYNDFLKICNNNEDLLNDFFQFYGYAITGKIMGENLIQIGKGSNGKSTMCDILQQYVLTKYIVKTGGKTFDKDANENNKSKFTATLCDSKARICFIEEINDNKFDTAFFKMLSGSETFAGKRLYEKNERLNNIYAKYVILTNEHPNFDKKQTATEDMALNRRFGTLKHKNKFVSQEYYNEKNRIEENLYIKDINFISKYENDEYKNGLLQILLKYSINFYNNKGLIYKTNIKETFIKINKNIDPVKKFLEDRTTYNNNSKISKKTLYNEFLYYYNRKTNITFDMFFNSMKEYKGKYYTEYNKLMMYQNIRGVYIGIELINDNNNNNDFDL